MVTRSQRGLGPNRQLAAMNICKENCVGERLYYVTHRSSQGRYNRRKYDGEAAKMEEQNVFSFWGVGGYKGGGRTWTGKWVGLGYTMSNSQRIIILKNFFKKMLLPFLFFETFSEELVFIVAWRHLRVGFLFRP